MRTRLAPTPSGFIHVGNAANFIACWLCARAQGGELVLRIEDVDTSRARPEYVDDLFGSLAWLGLDWDDGPGGPDDRKCRWFQSSPLSQARYREILSSWRERGLLYPCGCSRRDIALAAPQVKRLSEMPGFGRPYPGTCRGRAASSFCSGRDAWRLRLPEISDAFDDLWAGPQKLPSLADCGDPVLQRADGVFAYHLAVIADDADEGVTHVFRGADLLPWMHLHRHLHALLGVTPPRCGHHPLLGDAAGRRLSKSAGSTSLRALRAAGLRVESLLGRLLPFLHPELAKAPAEISLPELLSLGLPFPGGVRDGGRSPDTAAPDK